MKNQHSRVVLWVLITILSSLIACSSADTPTKKSERPLPSATVTLTREDLIPPGTTGSPAGSKETKENNSPPVPDNPPGDRAEVPASPLPAPLSPTAEPPAAELPAATTLQHTVQPGETLLGLATRYGVSMAAIQLANDMGDSINLVAGQTLTVPNGPQWANERPFWAVHVVQAGETLLAVARRYDLTIEEILRVNAIADPTLIHVDQPLVIPLTQMITLKAPRPTSPPVATAPPLALSARTSETNATRPTPADAASGAPLEDTSTPTETPAPPPPSSPAGPADWPNYILARINQARAEHGLNPLTIVPGLTQAAQAHAEDCARRGWGSHVGSDGAVLETRLRRVGYDGRNWGENWVQALNAERAFEWWYGEIPPNDPHRRNILSPRYTEIGIGIAQMDWGYVFITDFGRH